MNAFSLLLLAALAPRPCAPEVPQEWTILDLGTLGGLESRGRAVNNLGQVAGESDTGSGLRAFLFLDGALRRLRLPPGTSTGIAWAVNDRGAAAGAASSAVTTSAVRWTADGPENLAELPGHGYSEARGLNALGEIAGLSAIDAGSPTVACLWTKEGPLALGTLPGDVASAAHAVNGRGVVVGSSSGPAGERGFLYARAALVDLGRLEGDVGSRAHALNGATAVVGASLAASGAQHAFLWEHGTMSGIGALNGDGESCALGINDAGDVVGWSGDGGVPERAFLRRDGALLDLNDLLPPGSGWSLYCATAISNSSAITGWGNIGGETHAFLMIPAGLWLAGPASGVAGEANRLAVRGATPGGKVWFVASSLPGHLSSSKTCVELDMKRPVILPPVLADAAGRAEITVFPARDLRGKRMLFQAVDPAACASSNLVVHIYPD